jgi:hypothetical protein
VFGEPDEGNDVLEFGDTEPRSPRGTKRLRIVGAAATLVTGLTFGIGAVALHGGAHPAAPPPPARSGTLAAQVGGTGSAGHTLPELTAKAMLRFANEGTSISINLNIGRTASVPPVRHCAHSGGLP